MEISCGDRVTNEVLRMIERERNILHIIQRRKAEWTGHILLRKCHFRHVIEGKQKGDNGNDGNMGQIR